MKTISKEETYLQERWQKQKDYYSKESDENKTRHLGLQLFVTLAAIAVPILLAIPAVPPVIPTILSGLVAGATALENVFHYGDNWRNYRQTLEGLKRERALFDARAGSYDDPKKAFTRFVERVEALVSEETMRFFPEDRSNSKAQPSKG
jgi:Protein of unknown function (DUF4231)